ncbi:MAG: acyl carrier protein [Calditrichaeota bacterium]|nr:MAG: acyl carrier protein [Calditrichota bacterium]
MQVEQQSEVYRTAKKIVTDYLRLNEDEIQPDTHMVDDIGADSLALVELGFKFSETFGVPIVDTSDDKLVFKNLVHFIEEHMSEKKTD